MTREESCDVQMQWFVRPWMCVCVKILVRFSMPEVLVGAVGAGAGTGASVRSCACAGIDADGDGAADCGGDGGGVRLSGAQTAHIHV